MLYLYFVASIVYSRVIIKYFLPNPLKISCGVPGNILSFLLPLFQGGQLSVTGESMCTKYWLTA